MSTQGGLSVIQAAGVIGVEKRQLQTRSGGQFTVYDVTPAADVPISVVVPEGWFASYKDRDGNTQYVNSRFIRLSKRRAKQTTIKE